MKTLKNAAEAVLHAVDMFEQFELKDKGIFMAALADFAELCDEMSAEYDGRNERINELLGQ